MGVEYNKGNNHVEARCALHVVPRISKLVFSSLLYDYSSKTRTPLGSMWPGHGNARTHSYEWPLEWGTDASAEASANCPLNVNLASWKPSYHRYIICISSVLCLCMYAYVLVSSCGLGTPRASPHAQDPQTSCTDSIGTKPPLPSEKNTSLKQTKRSRPIAPKDELSRVGTPHFDILNCAHAGWHHDNLRSKQCSHLSRSWSASRGREEDSTKREVSSCLKSHTEAVRYSSYLFQRFSVILYV